MGVELAPALREHVAGYLVARAVVWWLTTASNSSFRKVQSLLNSSSTGTHVVHCTSSQIHTYTYRTINLFFKKPLWLWRTAQGSVLVCSVLRLGNSGRCLLSHLKQPYVTKVPLCVQDSTCQKSRLHKASQIVGGGIHMICISTISVSYTHKTHQKKY